MEIPEALEVVRRLANGQHPETGAAVAQDSLLHHPWAIRALNRALLALEFQRERERRRSLPANAGKAWSAEEDTQICEQLRHGASFETIAKLQCRTVGSIVARLIRLGKISASVPDRRTA
jgi:hypothetical protein